MKTTCPIANVSPSQYTSPAVLTAGPKVTTLKCHAWIKARSPRPRGRVFRIDLA
jgi:hypothetical protein